MTALIISIIALIFAIFNLIYSIILEREKAIKRLEECLSASCRGFKTCSYNDSERDAVEATVAEQEPIEPKVLTLKEVMKLRHGDEIWIEYGGAHSKLFMLTVARRRRWGFTFYRHFPCYWDNYGGKNNTNHDWWWRCWSNRPTTQQRKAVKWDE